jgi:hypothetical protein
LAALATALAVPGASQGVAGRADEAALNCAEWMHHLRTDPAAADRDRERMRKAIAAWTRERGRPPLEEASVRAQLNEIDFYCALHLDAVFANAPLELELARLKSRIDKLSAQLRDASDKKPAAAQPPADTLGARPLQRADSSPPQPPANPEARAAEPPAEQPVEIVVRAGRLHCRVQIADRVISDAEFSRRAKEWAKGTPVRVVVPSSSDYRCLSKIAFRLGNHGVRMIEFVRPRS